VRSTRRGSSTDKSARSKMKAGITEHVSTETVAPPAAAGPAEDPRAQALRSYDVAYSGAVRPREEWRFTPLAVCAGGPSDGGGRSYGLGSTRSSRRPYRAA